MIQPSVPSATEPILIRAAVLTDGHRCRQLSQAEAVAAAKDPAHPIWIDIFVKDPEVARSLLEDDLGFHELPVEDALSDLERPALQTYGDLLFLVVPALKDRNGQEHFVEVGFFLRNNALVTVAKERVETLDTWYDRFSKSPDWVGQNTSRLLHALIDGIVDAYFPVLDAIEDDVEETGDLIFGGDINQIRNVLKLKRRIISFRRTLLPVRDILNGLLRHDLHWISDDVRPYFQDVYDHVLRLTELLDVNRDTITSMLDVHLSTVSNNLNTVMKKMTVIATVLMTMSLVAGVYGMNFDRIPELHWMYGYPFAIGLMLGLSGLILVMFRRMKWL